MSAYRILYHHRIRANDGQAVHVRELIAAVRRRGHEVLECALVPKATPVLSGRSAARPSFWQRLSLPRTAVEVLEVLYNRKGRAMLRRAAASFRPDFIYERHALHCRAGLDVACEIGVPLLLEVNSPMVTEMQELRLLRLPWLARRCERAVLSGADRVLAVTSVLAAMLIERGAKSENVRVVPNGAQPERYGSEVQHAAAAVRARLKLAADAFVLGFVGYMRPWHRLDLVLEAMLLPGLSPLHLLLVGSGPALPMLLARAQQLGLAERVHSVGEVPSDLLPPHVAAFDAALVPAINPYASPLKLFDSLAASVPSLVPDQPNLREIISDGQNGLLFKPGVASSLAQSLRPLVADRALARKIGAQGRQSLLEHRFTWDGNAERVIAMVEDLLQKGAS